MTKKSYFLSADVSGVSMKISWQKVAFFSHSKLCTTFLSWTAFSNENLTNLLHWHGSWSFFCQRAIAYWIFEQNFRKFAQTIIQFLSKCCIGKTIDEKVDRWVNCHKYQRNWCEKHSPQRNGVTSIFKGC